MNSPAHPLHPFHQVVERCIARDIAGESRLGAGDDFADHLVHAEADEEQIRIVEGHAAHDLERVARRHIDDRDVGTVLRGEHQRLVQARRGCDDAERRTAGKPRVHAIAVEPDVGDDHHAHASLRSRSRIGGKCAWKTSVLQRFPHRRQQGQSRTKIKISQKPQKTARIRTKASRRVLIY